MYTLPTLVMIVDNDLTSSRVTKKKSYTSHFYTGSREGFEFLR